MSMDGSFSKCTNESGIAYEYNKVKRKTNANNLYNRRYL